MPTTCGELQLGGNSRSDYTVEAVPVGVLSGDNLEPRLPHASVARGHVVVFDNNPPSDRYHPPVRDNAPIQCCYPITVADPEEVVQARHIAIAQASFEAMLVIFCQSGWCAWAWLIAMPFSIIVASCCKHRVTYIAWGSSNVLVCWFHVVAAVEALGRHDGDLSSMGYSREFLTTVQMFLFSVGVLAAYIGFKTASALRSEVLPHARAEVLAIAQGSSAYLPVEEHYPQPPPMSVPLR